MHPKSPEWLEHVADHCGFILESTAGLSLAAYGRDRGLRQAVERSFEIVGEALLRLERTDPATASRITDYRQVIDFRNRLVHGYDLTDHAKVWQNIQDSLPVLKREVDALLAEAEREAGTGHST